MSYEGFQEYLCARGHYHCYDCQDDVPMVCGQHGCMARLKWVHQVDTTNGYDPRYEVTSFAERIPMGFDDIQKVDHYGNVYYEQHLRFAPAQGPAWAKVPTEEEIAAAEAEWERKQAIFAQPADKFRLFRGETLVFACHDEAEFEAAYAKIGEKDGFGDLVGYGPEGVED